ncbi:MAG: hypothetical protein WCH99_03910 [Verrucomicrobiota bacterium]
MILPQYIGLIFATGLVGIISGMVWLIPNGLMGGVLGICLSGGTIWLGIKQRQQSGEPSLKQVLIAGFVSGLLAGILMALVSHALAGSKRGDFGPPILPFWAPLFMGTVYGIAIHWSYHQRRGSSHPLRSVFFYACSTCFLLKTAGTIVYLYITENTHQELRQICVGATMLSLLGAVPFAFFWTLFTFLLDPTNSTNPPQNCNQGWTRNQSASKDTDQQQ